MPPDGESFSGKFSSQLWMIHHSLKLLDESPKIAGFWSDVFFFVSSGGRLSASTATQGFHLFVLFFLVIFRGVYNPFLVALYGNPGWPMLALLDLIDKLSQKKKLIIAVQKNTKK